MYIFILETIGTQELILVGLVALIVFGPRKLPQMARKFGKMMTEFRKVSNDFRSTWEREAAFEDEKVQTLGPVPQQKPAGEPISIVEDAPENKLLPEVKEMSQDDFEKIVEEKRNESETTEEPSSPPLDKQNWL